MKDCCSIKLEWMVLEVCIKGQSLLHIFIMLHSYNARWKLAECFVTHSFVVCVCLGKQTNERA